ncbi:MAG: nucleotide exchange factor GrpE [Gammaproteobacteria bacterium]
MKDEMSKQSAAPANELAGDDEAIAVDPQGTLKAALTDAKQQAAENRDAYLRMAAELDNLHKRSQRDLENAHKFALERFMQELLPVQDSLELGIAAADKSADGLKQGMDMTLKLLATVLERFGVSEVNPPMGEAFNPEQQEAIAMQASTEASPGTVLETVQKGYLLNGRLLRPARVIVAKTADSTA